MPQISELFSSPDDLKAADLAFFASLINQAQVLKKQADYEKKREGI